MTRNRSRADPKGRDQALIIAPGRTVDNEHGRPAAISLVAYSIKPRPVGTEVAPSRRLLARNFPTRPGEPWHSNSTKTTDQTPPPPPPLFFFFFSTVDAWPRPTPRPPCPAHLPSNQLPAMCIT